MTVRTEGIAPAPALSLGMTRNQGAPGEGSNMVGGDALEVFRERLARVLRGDLCLDRALSQRLSAEAAAMLATGGLDAAGALRARLAEWDIDRQWAQLLREERAQALADWVEPYARGTVVHLCAPDKLLCERLSHMGCPAVVAGRDGADGMPLCDTVLLTSSLSAATDADEMLGEVARSPATRLILIEAVVEEGSSSDLHALFDGVFERCLGQPPRGHVRRRTAEEWLALTERHGRVAALERWESVPGVPLPHALIAADLEPVGINGPR